MGLHFFPYHAENVLDFERQRPNIVLPGINLHEIAAWMENAQQQVAEPEPEPRPTASPAELAAVQRFIVDADGCDEAGSECAIWLEHHDNRCPICRQKLHATHTTCETAQLSPHLSPAQRLGELSVASSCVFVRPVDWGKLCGRA